MFFDNFSVRVRNLRNLQNHSFYNDLNDCAILFLLIKLTDYIPVGPREHDALGANHYLECPGGVPGMTQGGPGWGPRGGDPGKGVVLAKYSNVRSFFRIDF